MLEMKWNKYMRVHLVCSFRFQLSCFLRNSTSDQTAFGFMPLEQFRVFYVSYSKDWLLRISFECISKERKPFLSLARSLRLQLVFVSFYGVFSRRLFQKPTKKRENAFLGSALRGSDVKGGFPICLKANRRKTPHAFVTLPTIIPHQCFSGSPHDEHRKRTKIIMKLKNDKIKSLYVSRSCIFVLIIVLMMLELRFLCARKWTGRSTKSSETACTLMIEEAEKRDERAKRKPKSAFFQK